MSVRGKNGKVKRQSAKPNGSVRTTILMPEQVLKLGHEQAESRRRSFSNYLTTLIEADARKEEETANA